MDKKKYIKPTIQVIKLSNAPTVLVGSSYPPNDIPTDWNDN